MSQTKKTPATSTKKTATKKPVVKKVAAKRTAAVKAAEAVTKKAAATKPAVKKAPAASAKKPAATSAVATAAAVKFSAVPKNSMFKLGGRVYVKNFQGKALLLPPAAVPKAGGTLAINAVQLMATEIVSIKAGELVARA